MSLSRKITGSTPIRLEPKPKSVPNARRITISFEVETHLYPAEICEATRIALETAGIEVVSCSGEFTIATPIPRWICKCGLKSAVLHEGPCINCGSGDALTRLTE